MSSNKNSWLYLTSQFKANKNVKFFIDFSDQALFRFCSEKPKILKNLRKTWRLREIFEIIVILADFLPEIKV